MRDRAGELAAPNISRFDCRHWKWRYNPKDYNTSVVRPKRPSNNKCLIFYHIPKTAGEALHEWADYNGLKVWSHYNIWDKSVRFDDRSTLPWACSVPGGPVEFSEAQIYMGHFTPGAKGSLFSREMLGGRRCYEATVLREPRNRTLSQVYYAHKGSKSAPVRMLGHPEKLVHPNVSLSTYLDDRRWYFDTMCRQFSGLTPTWDTFDWAYGDNFSSTCDVGRAKGALRKLDYVGFLEEIDAFMAEIGVLLGVPVPEQVRIKHKNGSNNRGFEALAQDDQDLVTKANAADIDLYAWARQALGRRQQQQH